MSIDPRSAAIAVLLFIGGFALTLGAYSLLDGGDGGQTTVRQTTPTASITPRAPLGTGTSTIAVVSVTPRPAVTPTPAATATPTPLPDRRDCNAIAGSDYRSDAERDFYLANCLGQAPAPTSTPEMAITVLPTQPAAPTATRTPTRTPTATPTRTPSIIATPTRGP